MKHVVGLRASRPTYWFAAAWKPGWAWRICTDLIASCLIDSSATHFASPLDLRTNSPRQNGSNLRSGALVLRGDAVGVSQVGFKPIERAVGPVVWYRVAAGMEN